MNMYAWIAIFTHTIYYHSTSSNFCSYILHLHGKLEFGMHVYFGCILLFSQYKYMNMFIQCIFFLLTEEIHATDNRKNS